MISFGPWSTTLALGMLFGSLVAGLLATSAHNRTANRLLAAALVVIVLKLSPYMLGFAGYFDAYPWLTFLPVSFGFALGPLLYLHVLRLTRSALPPGWRWHLLPAALQFAYYAVLFVQPLDVKYAWSDAVDGPWLDPLETGLELVSLAVYVGLAERRWRHYQAWLDGHLSNREEFRAPWLRHVVWVLAGVLPLWVGFEIASAWGTFDYFQRFPLYVGLSCLLLYLGLEGWRQAACHYPAEPLVDESLPSPDPAAPPAAAPPPGTERDWRETGERWHDQLRQAGWSRDPSLSLAKLARLLGTNTNYLTRAFNEGLGRNFNEVVNALRVQDVQRSLASQPADVDLLALAHDAGFSSKSSFNRLFKRYAGMTPSAYRARLAREGASPDVPERQ